MYGDVPPHEVAYLHAAGMLIKGAGKRKGAFAIYLEPWHADIFGLARPPQEPWKGRGVMHRHDGAGRISKAELGLHFVIS